MDNRNRFERVAPTRMRYFVQRTRKGWIICRPDGQRQSGPFGCYELAVQACEGHQARADAALVRTRRPCMCCGKEFSSAGKHNRLCDYCRTLEGGAMPSHGIAQKRRSTI
jgi:hypothetical protein